MERMTVRELIDLLAQFEDDMVVQINGGGQEEYGWASLVVGEIVHHAATPCCDAWDDVEGEAVMAWEGTE